MADDKQNLSINPDYFIKGKMPEDEILKRLGASELLKIPVRTIDFLVTTGQIPFSRLGKRSVRFSKNRLLEWFHEREGVEYHKKAKK